ncbi:hypothetical protein NP92_11310 [Anoxybacillus gonensis]|uniref:Uncharacterized protein n=2 Tax=Anoxybacillus TaxID=150247 RepID=A0AAW7TE26_9BACL|nr:MULTISPECIES: hypothetical protein [Anoxybacillus]AXM90102.1 hypothetical protein B379_13580 [Anoxybacillus ayderensis G10]THD15851.1 hypothetical protein CI793_10915 [Anoxybacillus ayderensis]AKS38641.1 hypothetical protein AFK25_08735 [Anoxybacillus gonensis]KGP60246.1 hypothetical protein NP92_11310 [Anoxybacillus gonensis]MBW9218201.1 hypothetical protein [Anoxybacillus sp. ST70]
MKHLFEDIEKKMRVLEQEFQLVNKLLYEMKKEKNNNYPSSIQAISYFTYSFMLPRRESKDGMVIGNFIIRNMGSIPLDNPVICLKMIPKEYTGLTAKLGEHVSYDRRINPLVMEAWQYIDENAERIAEENGEFWIKPIQIRQIKEGEQLAFANFQIKLRFSDEINAYKIYGFFYCTQFPKGIKSLNDIIIHG